VLRNHKEGVEVSHINPSCPGCKPRRGNFRISSRVTPSLLNNPPWVTKYLFIPFGERIALLDDAGGFVALIIVASGTVMAAISTQ
jgi:hypothetical protein